MSKATKELLARLDWDMKNLFVMVEKLCNEAHLDDETIKDILNDGDSEQLEIISDTADEMTAKALPLIVEARLAISTFLETHNG